MDRTQHCCTGNCAVISLEILSVFEREALPNLFFYRNQTIQVLKKLTVFDTWSNIAVHVALDNILVKEDVEIMATLKIPDDAVKLAEGMSPGTKRKGFQMKGASTSRLSAD